MIEFPIIYLISAIGAEIVKDVTKHLGKKTYEIASNLEGPIISLGINNYANPEEIQNKLDAKPEIKLQIEEIYQASQTEFNNLIKAFKESSNVKINNFYNKDNKKVINIDTNHGPINM